MITESQTDRAIEMYGNGAGIPAIANELLGTRNYGAIKRAITGRGIKLRGYNESILLRKQQFINHISDRERGIIVEMYRIGHGIPGIAKKLGLKDTEVEACLSANGVQTRSKKDAAKVKVWKRLSMEFSDAETARIIEMHKEGFGYKAISKEIIGKESARPIIRILRNSGVDIRGMEEGKMGSPAFKARCDGMKIRARMRNRVSDAEMKRNKLRIRKGFNRIYDLPLFGVDNPRIRAEQESKRRELSKKKSRDFRKRYQSDTGFRMMQILRSRFKKITQRGRGGKGEELLGCSYSEFRMYIESQWREGMTWDNYGGSRPMRGRWHIDHIVPCSWFDHTNETHASVCWHHTNMRPEWALANISRNDVMTFGDLESLLGLERNPITELLATGAANALNSGASAWVEPLRIEHMSDFSYMEEGNLIHWKGNKSETVTT